jgi:hypothetical protein
MARASEGRILKCSMSRWKEAVHETDGEAREVRIVEDEDEVRGGERREDRVARPSGPRAFHEDEAGDPQREGGGKRHEQVDHVHVQHERLAESDPLEPVHLQRVRPDLAGKVLGEVARVHDGHAIGEADRIPGDRRFSVTHQLSVKSSSPRA